jgi:hypothetical protein
MDNVIAIFFGIRCLSTLKRVLQRVLQRGLDELTVKKTEKEDARLCCVVVSHPLFRIDLIASSLYKET